MTLQVGDEGKGLVFLLGVPRSGTTLLATMLDRHPAITAPPEPWLMLALSELGRVSPRHPAGSTLVGSAVDQFLGRDGLILSARGAASAIYQNYLERSGASIFIDKTPRYALILDFIIAVFPCARYIWLRRDPMDVAASYLATWDTDLAKMLASRTDAPEIFDLTIGLDRLIEFRKQRTGFVQVVHYENLVRDPHQELAKLLPHIGLEAEESTIESMVAFNTTERPKSAFGDIKIHATTRVHANSIGRWKSILDDNQLQILFDAIGPRRMVELGYAETIQALKQRGIVQRDASVLTGYQLMARRYQLARRVGYQAKLDARLRRPRDAQDGKTTPERIGRAVVEQNSVPFQSIENSDLGSPRPLTPLANKMWAAPPAQVTESPARDIRRHGAPNRFRPGLRDLHPLAVLPVEVSLL